MLVVCTNNQDEFENLKGFITVDKDYIVLGEKEGSYSIIDDNGKENFYCKSRFAVVRFHDEIIELQKIVIELKNEIKELTGEDLLVYYKHISGEQNKEIKKLKSLIEDLYEEFHSLMSYDNLEDRVIKVLNCERMCNREKDKDESED